MREHGWDALPHGGPDAGPALMIPAAIAARLGEYGRGPIHTNTIEGYFSIFKRGMKGIYQHCGE